MEIRRFILAGMTGCATEPLNAPATVKNQLTGLTYDAAGNVTNDGSHTATYDAESRIVADGGVNYSYDADGQRMEKSNGTFYWYGASGEVLAESDLSGNINEEYIFFNGARLARVDRPSGTVHYYFSDHLGSASVITDAAGNVGEQYFYYPYGGMVAQIGSDSNHYKFNGKERDAESGLDNFGARYDSSNLGRFMTPDWAAKPITVPYAKFGDPQTLNLYTYVENAPINRADADGHYEVAASGCTGTHAAKCQKKYDKKIDKFEKARQKDLKSKDPRVRAGAASYGDRGEVNGVHVAVAKLGPGIKGSVDDNSGFGKTDIEVKINSNLSGKSLQETVAHEGSHVEDDQAYQKSPMDVFGNHDQTLNLTHGQTEFNAYKTGAGVDREHGFGPNDDQKIRDFINNDPNYAPIIDDPTHTPED